jgi:serine/threonine protein kinase
MRALHCTARRGTPQWAAAEMLAASDATPVDAYGSDVWALGCMLFHLLTGDLLFSCDGDVLRPLHKVRGVGSAAACHVGRAQR